MKKILIFCLPYAGGTASSFLVWKNYLNNCAEIIPVELAGRGSRISDPPYGCFDEMVDETFDYIKEVLSKSKVKEYMIFGHSMGGIITYELCKRIFKSNFIKPVHVIFSGVKTPYHGVNDVNVSVVSDEQLEDIVKECSQEKENIIGKETYSELFLSILRKDLELTGEYVFVNDNFTMDINISIFSGLYDEINDGDLCLWRECTTGKCDFYQFAGEHFFFETCEQEVMKVMREIIIGIQEMGN